MAETTPPYGSRSRIATRRFVVVCHRALPPCACEFRLADLKEKRLDLVARCISSSLFLSEGTRRDTEVLFCFPKVDHEHLGNMRQRLNQKKQQPEEDTVDTQASSASRPLGPSEATAAAAGVTAAAAAGGGAAAAAGGAGVTAGGGGGVTAEVTAAEAGEAEATGATVAAVTGAAAAAASVYASQTPVDAETDDDAGWLVLRVSGDDVRHLRPDERSVGSILRHFLYEGECNEGNKSRAHHAPLLNAQGYRALCPDRLCSSLSKGWMNLPLKKCCKGVSFKRISKLAEVIPCSGRIENFAAASKEGVLVAEAKDGDGCRSSSGDDVVPREKKMERSLVHMMHLLAPEEDSDLSPKTILEALSPSSSCISLNHQAAGDESLGATVTRSFVMGDDVGFMQSDRDEVRSLDGVPTSLGPGMLLSSHCVVLLNHYMDLMVNAASGSPRLD